MNAKKFPKVIPITQDDDLVDLKSASKLRILERLMACGFAIQALYYLLDLLEYFIE